MSYTRTYPLGTGSYLPSDNQILKSSYVTPRYQDGEWQVTGVAASIVTANGTGSFVTLSPGPGTSAVYPISKTFRVKGGTGTTYNLFAMDGLTGNSIGWTAGNTGGTYALTSFKSTRPSSLDGPCEAILLSAATAGTSLTGITTDGQYFDLPCSALVAGAIYTIGIRTILTKPLGLTGQLLGNCGMMGGGIIG